MRYVSTRGAAPALGFADVLLTGLARDGGLYVPGYWPALPPGGPARFTGRTYPQIAAEVMAPFVEGSPAAATLPALVEEAYATFRHPDVVPLVPLEGFDREMWLLELFHGPTLAFKDVALQLVGRLFDTELNRRSERITVVGATSGDTGSAAIEACRDRATIEVFMLHPAGRVSEVQRRQMTTVDSANVHNIAVEGTFDDCQDLVKAMFNDLAFRDRLQLSAVNSINWARVMAQVPYYVHAAEALGGGARPIAFSVPTGNFGNVLSGWVAAQLGVPVDGLIVGSNRNDILARFLDTGRMEMAGVHPTISPSMDIQVSSNFERLLFELLGRDGEAVAQVMAGFRRDGRFDVSPTVLAELRRTFRGARLDDDETRRVMADVRERTGMLVDPHTAVGIGAALLAPPAEGVEVVALATVHPAKFPDAVEAATGVRPALPDHLADLLGRPERFVTLPNDVTQVQSYISSRAAVLA